MQPGGGLNVVLRTDGVIRIAAHRSSGPAVEYVSDGCEVDFSRQENPREPMDSDDIKFALQAAEDAVVELAELGFDGLEDWARSRYLIALIGTCACKEVGGSTQDHLWAWGPSGSGKSSIPRLAAELMGSPMPSITADRDAKKLERTFGYFIQEGVKLILLDEWDKPFTQARAWGDALVPMLLALGSDFTFDPKNRDVIIIPELSTFVLTGTEVPEEILGHQQLSRRIREVKLEKALEKDWRRTAGEIRAWRGLRPENARAGDRVVSRVFDLARACGFRLHLFDDFCGITPLWQESNAVVGDRIRAMRRLYMVWRHSCLLAMGHSEGQTQFGDARYIHGSPAYLDVGKPNNLPNRRHMLDVLDDDLHQRFGLLWDLFGTQGPDYYENRAAQYFHKAFKHIKYERDWARELGKEVELQFARRGRCLGVTFVHRRPGAMRGGRIDPVEAGDFEENLVHDAFPELFGGPVG